ncbi:MAG TPA: pacearchaeosortase [Nanoarchaeota archaeon]|nr:pacearchaeosortase [Nanoarchaeota archaeon]
MEKDSYARELALRLLTAFAVGISYNLFYMVLSPVTLYLSYFFFSLFHPMSALAGSAIQTQTASFELIPACVATAAYVLLAFLILLTKDISPADRLQMFVYGSLGLLAFNILRIELLLLTYFRLNASFDALHLFVWKFMSTAFVVVLWLALARIYRVKSIPVYSDFVHIAGMIRKK